MSLASYLEEVHRLRRTGQAREHAYRPALVHWIQEYLQHADIVNDPARTRFGVPDILVQRRRIPIGYVEAKDLETDLDAFERDEQFARYLNAISNLITTNYEEFRWYRNHRSIPVRTVRVGDAGADSSFRNLLKDFFDWNSAQISDEHELARQLARVARTFQAIIQEALREGMRTVHDQYAAFRTVLIAELSQEDFSDIYAQTVAYGLLVARLSMPEAEELTRLNAPGYLPAQNEFLQRIFDDLAGRNMEPRLEWLVGDICVLLNGMQVADVLRSFTRASDDDIVVTFYELFLREYDPEQRVQRGVFFTPRPVANFMVRGVHELLRQYLGHPRGISSAVRLDPHDDSSPHEVQVLDPATGTGTFLYEIIELISAEHGAQRGLFARYVRTDLLPRMFAFEVLMAPYVVAHLKLVLELRRLGVELASTDKLHLYLTNTLTDTGQVAQALPFQNWISRASVEASRIKRENAIMVVIGNPPYSINSANLTAEARSLVDRYRSFKGHPIREGGTLQFERNIQNDYVKFFSFAEQRINHTGKGILAFITSNSYLKSPTLRGLRESLLRSFNHIFILNLGGRRRPGADNVDENVFAQIQEGVAIILAVRTDGPRTGEYASVSLTRIRGDRAGKYRSLRDAWESHHFETVDLSSPNLTFSVGDRAAYFGDWTLPLSAADRRGPSVFKVRGGAIVTARDDFVIGFSSDEIVRRVEAFGAYEGTIQDASAAVGIRWAGDWRRRAQDAQRWVRQNRVPLGNLVHPISYRPFDERYIFYDDHFLDTPARRIMQPMLSGDNYALAFGRSSAAETSDHFLVTRNLVEAKCAERSRQCHAAPLWMDVSVLGTDTRVSNFTQELHTLIQRRIGLNVIDAAEGDRRTTVGALDVLGYIYAVVNSTYYRERIADLVAEDYPRVPFTSDRERFQHLSQLGTELIRYHTDPSAAGPISIYPIAGTDLVVRERWEGQGDMGSIWINPTQYFAEVPRSVWEYRIGGWQVVQEWLKRRRGKILNPDQILRFQYIMGALAQSVDVIERIDEYVDDDLIERGV